MGWRFRKTVGFGRLVRLNFSGRGVSLGLGPRGASVNISKRGVRQTFSIPGTGLSHSTFSPWGDRPPHSSASHAAPEVPSPLAPMRLPPESPPEFPSPPPVNWRKLAIVVGVLGLIVWGLVANDKGAATTTTSTAMTSPQSPQSPSSPQIPQPLPTPPSANRALTFEEVKEAQTLLKVLGFDPGGADGIVGPMTIAAVKRYEPSRGWPASGEIDLRLLESLRASKAAPAAPKVVALPPAAPAAPAPTSRSATVTVVPNEEMRVAARAIRTAEHPCGTVAAAVRLSDGSIKAVCSNEEIYRVMLVRGEWFALRCSAALRYGIQGC